MEGSGGEFQHENPNLEAVVQSSLSRLIIVFSMQVQHAMQSPGLFQMMRQTASMTAADKLSDEYSKL